MRLLERDAREGQRRRREEEEGKKAKTVQLCT